LAVAIAAGLLLFAAWVAWAIHVTSDNGARAGFGVLVAWPALLVGLALISLPLIWAFRLIRGARASGARSGSVDFGGSESEEAHDSGGSESTRAEATEPG
jgi:hypothetical protein